MLSRARANNASNKPSKPNKRSRDETKAEGDATAPTGGFDVLGNRQAHALPQYPAYDSVTYVHHKGIPVFANMPQNKLFIPGKTTFPPGGGNCSCSGGDRSNPVQNWCSNQVRTFHVSGASPGPRTGDREIGRAHV